MCLETKQNTWLRAETDIKCYKKVFYKYSTNEYYTPFQSVRIPKKVINGKRCFRAMGFAKFVKTIQRETLYSVQGGAIHAYSSEERGRAEVYFYNDALFECIIPKGTKYAVGNDNDICAKKIKFIKRIE